MKYVLVALFIQSLLVLGVGLDTAIAQGFSVKNLALYLLMGFVAMRMAVSGVPGWSRGVQSINFVYIGLLVWAILSIVLIRFHPQVVGFSSVQAGISIKNELLDPFLFFFLYYFFSQKHDDAEFLIKALVLVMGVGALITIGDVYGVGGGIFGFDQGNNRPNGPMGEPNQTAAVFALFIPVALLFALSGTWKILWMGVTLCFLVALALTGSRGGVLGAAMALATSALLLGPRLPAGRVIGFLFFIVLGLSLVYVVLPESYQDLLVDRFVHRTEEAKDLHTASAGRTTMWATGFEHWTTSPIVGYGWGTFRHLAGSSSHNTYLDIMVNLGLIGLILYLSVFVRVISHLGRAARLLKTSTALIARATIAGIIGMATSVFFVNLYKPWLVVWAFIGLVVGLTARDFALERATVKRKVHARMHAHR